ncbi:MAG: hypothetical protein OXU45_00360 [Candidatus Melainabacteria bacterium]|nr:hypothetical protein [Candidatus Melainabacteria bacterium]
MQNFGLIFLLCLTMVSVSAKKIDNGMTGASCGDQQVLFERSPLDMSDLRTIVPLGNFNPAGHSLPTKHFYMHLRREVEMDYSTDSALSPVYAPADMKIFKLNSSAMTSMNTIYSIFFSPCKEVTGYFLHVTQLGDTLLDALETEQQCETHEPGTEFERQVCFADVDLEVEAGQLLGYAGGDDENNELDWGLFDTRIKQHKVGSKKRWANVDHSQDHRVTACAIDYFPDESKTELESYLGYFETKRRVEPLCGNFQHDIRGTASGMWFSTKASAGPYPETEHMTLADDILRPELALFSIGQLDDELESGVYLFEPQSSGLINRDFADVKKDGKAYCYETHPGSLGQYDDSITKVFAIKLKSPKKLQFQALEQETCDDFELTRAAKILRR